MMDSVRAPVGRICLLCNKPMGAEPHFITEYPHGQHVECWKRQIAGEKFPYSDLLEELRCKAGHMKTAYRAVERFGKWLRAMETGWPGTRDRLLAEFRGREIELKRAVEELVVKVR
ncbi:MAG: hypothetical protein GY866_09180 [Proteobacteria bacterium]|nr:hypothetical protein [Pseudomonadota bacterium]